MRSRSGENPAPQIRRLAPPPRAAASATQAQAQGPAQAREQPHTYATGFEQSIASSASPWETQGGFRPPSSPPPGTPPAAQTGSGGIDRDTMLAGVGCVLMLFAGVVIAGIFALRMVKNDDPAVVPDSSQVAAIGQADNASSPEATAVFPSPTPKPTNTPFSTPWPTWTPLPDYGTGSVRASDYRGHDSEYRQDVQEINDFMQASAKEVTSLLKTPQADDSMWMYKMSNQIDVWTVMFQYMQASNPPTRYESFHADFVKAMARLDGAASDIIYAVDYNDPSGFATASGKIEQGIALLKEVMAGFRPSA